MQQQVKQYQLKVIFDELTAKRAIEIKNNLKLKSINQAIRKAVRDFFELKADDYQKLASRTMNGDLTQTQQAKHALHGMVGEIGELHSLYQKKYQGHGFDKEHAKKELGDLMWFVAEYCTANGWKLSEIMLLNVEKLKARYPKGFDSNNSLNRKEGDI